VKPDQKRITVDLPAELWAEVKKMAIDQRRTASRLVREMLVQYTEGKKES
jgi:metal-responsive CopG/Arc/MetJ family transcriptional regulator